MSEITLFTGNSNPRLAHSIADRLHIPLGKAHVGRFSDGEVLVEVLENVRGKDVFILQSTCFPTNDHLMELMLLADAIHRASASRITAVIPYFGYARQDRRTRSARVPISAKIVADMLSRVGVNRVLTVDLHADQIQGFFSIPVDNTYGSLVLLQDIEKQRFDNLVVVSPDVGGVVRARAFAMRLDDADLAIIDKRRPYPNQSVVMNIIGKVKDRTCVLVDDIIDTAGTLCIAAKVLKDQGATHVSAFITHPVLSGAAIDNIEASCLDELVVTDTIPLSDRAAKCKRIRQLSTGEMLSEAIRRINGEESLSCMFD